MPNEQEGKFTEQQLKDIERGVNELERRVQFQFSQIDNSVVQSPEDRVDKENAKVAASAIKAYNGKAGMYEQVVQKRGQPLREGFTIVKVRATRESARIRTPSLLPFLGASWGTSGFRQVNGSDFRRILEPFWNQNQGVLGTVPHSSRGLFLHLFFAVLRAPVL